MLACLLFSLLADPLRQSPAAPSKTTDHGQRTTDKPVWIPKDKETVVLLGSAFIEQEARDGYLETELIRLFPNKDIRVRNLGWSGDTVHCQARSYFGPPQEGFERLRGHLQMIKPTTVICCYGANESWKGEPGIEGFRKGYEKLIDMIREATGATVVVMNPPRFSFWNPSYPSDHEPTQRLHRYWREIGYIADAKKVLHAQLDSEMVDRRESQRPDSKWILFSPIQYERWGRTFGHTLFGDQINGSAIIVDVSMRSAEPKGNVTKLEVMGDRVAFTAASRFLGDLVPIKITGSAPCEYRLKIDGEELRSSVAFDKGTPVEVWWDGGAETKQLEQLRQAIVKKNALFFHRWRPANETYLYGFRKHEQGNNGVEPPMFDKLVEQAEAEIAVLKKPVPHKYELMRVEENKK